MLNKTQSLKHFVYLVGLHIYYKMIHGPYNIKLLPTSWMYAVPCLNTVYKTHNFTPLVQWTHSTRKQDTSIWDSWQVILLIKTPWKSWKYQSRIFVTLKGQRKKRDVSHRMQSNNCTTVRYSNIQTCDKPPTCFGLFSDIFRDVFTKENITAASYAIDV